MTSVCITEPLRVRANPALWTGSKTAWHAGAPRENAISVGQANVFCERLIGSARRECLDFMIPINEDHVRWIMKQSTGHYNKSRPHSSLGRVIRWSECFRRV